MKYNTASYRCPLTQTIIGYSTPNELPESIVRDGMTLIKE
jgi:hypothetical protein